MTLFSITLRNVRKNFRNYVAYFLSSSFSVFAIYLFMSILYSENIQDQLGSMKKFITLFYVGAVMITLFSAFFIWYSNSFFVRSRKKEFATYMLLGMSKRQVAMVNFLENIIIMFLSLLTGIILGLIFTKFFIMLLFFMIKTPVTVPFQWSIKALRLCLTIFLGIFIIITVHGFIIIRTSKLIDLFNASKKVERGLRVSFLTVVLGMLAVVFLAIGYNIAIKKLAYNFVEAPIVVLLVVVGTIFFFTSTTSLLIYLSKKNEKRLFKGTKLISTAQLFYRYKGNVGTLSVIAITTTVALCALVTCIGSYGKTEENSRYMRPFSVEYFNNGGEDKIFQDILSNYKQVTVKYKDDFQLLKTIIRNPSYDGNEEIYIISEKDFNNINDHQGQDRKIQLKENDDCYFVKIQNYTIGDPIENKNIPINIGSQNYNFKVTLTDTKPFIALDHFKETVVVKDSVFENMKSIADKGTIAHVTGYMLQNDFKADDFTTELLKTVPDESSVKTFYDHYADGLKLLGMMAFIGLFIGMLFIMATGGIIYFKMNMEAREDKSKFITLRKIGVSKKEIKMSVAKELLIFFGTPLLIAAINTYPATVALSKMLALKLMGSYVAILVVYVLVYCVYYFVTLGSYMREIEG
ncbi:FtsX-like permease family protein [Clostridium cellulovorans]|uniref:ABC3 transporter permease C-terminal domain-containing protein n=1 Tax=Clostridium cellulovorans (strain ATCC 35296 / DSM 3052 / OCM 3 / 743B) TaxID=573061 RepID=D9SMH0_CLOC7|nr:ABC transporter permease [Clostridium cellulovorans]ADL53826.1 protein of unknown function DUF214 [Clostridium cellulovorans 743B]